ncbi:hypothetical protein [Sphingomonas sp. Leaf10]|uniref:hypothetical protein n=1 Tax=Sphingomonas sp. Leaf10 TaxID=1735676 RepID=UPI00070135F9|nr:hypothetical protein [Sphingomonas sp. Leaf10]KQM37435.1 hypothetical protein ASE59_14780 [Sphingomonas sp. Leaf10]
MRIESVHIDAERALRVGHRACPLAEIEAIRAIATAESSLPALTVLAVVDAALARGERRSIGEWTALAREAMHCGRSDAVTAQAYAAACTVRLAD